MEYDPQLPPAPPESQTGEPASEPPAALLGEAPSEAFIECAPEPPRDRYPFWGYADIVVFFGLAFPCLLLGFGIVQGVLHVFHVRPHNMPLALVPSQCLGYGFVFFARYLILRHHYHRPFWSSLRWVHTRPRSSTATPWCFLLAFAVALVGRLLQTPDVNTPMKQLLSDRSSVLLIAIFAVTLGPLCEELAFRGFLQPVLVRSFGPVPGVILAAVPFGLLHLSQYGGAWRHVVLVTLAGVGFGWMRHISGSARAATIMHAAYNFIFVAALLSQWKELPKTW